MTKTMVVVGPNRGDATIGELSQTHNECWLIEPMPDAVAWLRERNPDPRVHIVQAACGSVGGRAKMLVYNGGLSSSLGECTAQARQTYAAYDLSEQGEIEVDVINLSEFLHANSVTEIETLITDAQGMDLTILRTMREWLEAGRIQSVICECDHDGFRHYDGLPDNSFSGFMAFMGEFSHYEFDPETNLTLVQPDLKWNKI